MISCIWRQGRDARIAAGDKSALTIQGAETGDGTAEIMLFDLASASEDES
jgi:hypothetical protein